MHEKYMRIALESAREALDQGDFPVGCVIVDKNGVVCTGKRENSGKNGNELDHAEIMALRKLHSFHGQSASADLVVYSTMEPCLMCYSTLILNNIRKIVFAYEDVMGGGTACDLTKLTPLYKNLNVPVIPNILREKSLGLFKEYFSNPKILYWKDSLLARYTLDQ
jgi:tRNA(adenine34) deaminase